MSAAAAHHDEWRMLLDVVRHYADRLSSREQDFLASLEQRAANDDGLSDRQFDWLANLAAELPVRPDLEEIRQGLVDRFDELVRELFGEPTRHSVRRAQWEWDSTGGTSAVVQTGNGKSRGAFYVHASDAGGGPLDAIMHARGCGIGDAIRWAKDWLGFSAPGYQPKPIDDTVLAERARQRAEQQAEAEAYRARRADDAARIWAEAVQPIGTPGPVYLINRAVDLPSPAPEAVRWHVRRHALAFAATRTDGTVQAVQLVYTGSDAQKLDAAAQERRGLPSAKITTGPADGAAVRFPGAPDGPLLLCEGPETGLSAWTATSHETWVALGQVSKLEPPAGRLIVICRDDDKKPRQGQRGPTPEDRHRKLVAELRGRGHQVVTVLPWAERRFDGSDLNDLLQAEGPDAVRERINGAVPPDLPPEHPAPTHDLNAARATLKPIVEAFFRSAIVANTAIDAFLKQQKGYQRELKALKKSAGEEPTVFQKDQIAELEALLKAASPAAPHEGLKVGLGIGKTHATGEEVAVYLAEARAAGITHGVLWTAPTLDLADQTRDMLADHGLSVGVYRGRRAPNPEATTPPKGPNDDEGRMCLDLPSVRLAHDAGANVAESVCGKERGEDHERCVHFPQCPFQRNNKALRDVDIVVAAHNALLQELPSKVEAGRGLTIIDETFWQAGLSTTEIALGDLTGDILDAPVRGKGDEEDWKATESLQSTMNALVLALGSHEDATPVVADTFRRAGLEAAHCRGQARVQWRRMIPLAMRPGMPIEERRAAARDAATNRRIPGMVRLLHTVADILDGNENALGRVELTTSELKKGTERRVALHYLRGMVKARLERPVLHLDATMPVAAVRQYLSRLEITAEVEATTPHMRLVQVLSTRENRGGWGKNSVIPDDATEDEERDRREKRLSTVRDLAGGMRRHLGTGLVVTYKAIEDRFASEPGIATAHFNAVAGLNEHKDVAFAIVLGRPMPNPRATAEIVKQLFGRWADAAAPIETPAGLLMADGSRRTIVTRRFADPDMEAVRRAIADDNVTQALGRVRAVRRTRANPVTVLLLSDVVTPFPVNAVADWPTMALDRVERMAARGVILDSPTDAAKAFPDLFVNANAARIAFKADRRSSGQTPRIIYILGNRPLDQAAAKARYRPLPSAAEPRPKTRTMTVTDPALLPALKGWLEQIVGPLALFEVAADEPAPEPDPKEPRPRGPAAPAGNPVFNSETRTALHQTTIGTKESPHMPIDPHARPQGALLDPAVMFPRKPPGGPGPRPIGGLFTVSGPLGARLGLLFDFEFKEIKARTARASPVVRPWSAPPPKDPQRPAAT